jgi:hypothetical protein
VWFEVSRGISLQGDRHLAPEDTLTVPRIPRRHQGPSDAQRRRHSQPQRGAASGLDLYVATPVATSRASKPREASQTWIYHLPRESPRTTRGHRIFRKARKTLIRSASPEGQFPGALQEGRFPGSAFVSSR